MTRATLISTVSLAVARANRWSLIVDLMSSSDPIQALLAQPMRLHLSVLLAVTVELCTAIQAQVE
jgi:hypothetical protein